MISEMTKGVRRLLGPKKTGATGADSGAAAASAATVVASLGTLAARGIAANAANHRAGVDCLINVKIMAVVERFTRPYEPFWASNF
jgi:hypothetical protein